MGYYIKYKGVISSFLLVDGNFGAASATATVAFQRKFSLIADGWFASSTIAKMKSILGIGTATVTRTSVTLKQQSATVAGTTIVRAKYGAVLPAITIPKRTGYTFGGYYTG